MIVGAATGGIITVALSGGMNIQDILDIYLKNAKVILPSNFFKKIWNPVNLFAPKYSSKNLKTLLEDKIGASKTLRDVHKKYGTDTIFLCGALNMSPKLKQGETPEFKVEIYNSALKTHENETLVDIALRNSAAAINLPLYQGYSESGNYANDPSLIALSFLMNQQIATESGTSHLDGNRLGLGLQPHEIKFLSLGCGADGRSFVPRKKIGKGNWGLLKWLGYLISLVIETNMVASRYYMQQFLDENHYLRLSAYYKAENAPEILKNKKLKLDVRDTEQLQAIKEYGEFIFEKEKDKLLTFLEL